MSGELNPYESPRAPPDDGNRGTPIRTLNVVITFLVGSLLGILSFMPAIALIPSDVPDPSVHDLRLANNLGFIYPIVLGLWSAWLRRSWQWACIGIVAGLGIGITYFVLCGYDFLSVMVAFPCLLGGGAAVVL